MNKYKKDLDILRQHKMSSYGNNNCPAAVFRWRGYPKGPYSWFDLVDNNKESWGWYNFTSKRR